MPADGAHNALIEDNVWVCTCIYPWSIQAAATQNSKIIHNTFAGGGGIHFHTGQGWVAAGNVVRDNVFTDPSNGITRDSSSSGWGTQDHNLDSGMSGTGNITGTAIFSGGANPTTYAGYQLAPSSPGYLVASDGKTWYRT